MTTQEEILERPGQPRTHSIEIELITPETAERYLALNTSNRPVRKSHLARLKADALGGQWKFTGDPIQFATAEGAEVLINGQHRLMMVAETGIPQKFAVVRGLPIEAQKVMDQGAVRSLREQMMLEGLCKSKHTPPAMRLYVLWQSGDIDANSLAAKAKYSTPALIQWAEDHPDEIALLDLLAPLGAAAPGPPRVTLACGLAFALLDVDAAETFLRRLADGVGLPEGSPVLAIRNRLIKDPPDLAAGMLRNAIGRMVTAWNYWREGKPLMRLVTGNWTAETLPVPK